ncbi:MAG: sulfatase-like hydrolase/transferase [Planctomycetota bacterium]
MPSLHQLSTTRTRRALSTIATAAAAGVATAGSTLVPPNIILFYVDDMGVGDSSVYQALAGNPDEHQLDTPELERLAALGTIYTDAHSSSAVCTPSRISILSGALSFRSPLKQRVGFEGQDVKGTYFPGDRTTIPSMLQRHGYGTYGYGKWHLGVQGDKEGTGLMDEGPLQVGFDTFTGTPGNFANGSSMIRDHQYLSFNAAGEVVPINAPDALLWQPADNPDFIEKIQQVNVDSMQADLDAHLASRGHDPFFVFFASHSNHTPWVVDDQIEGVSLTTDVTVAGGPVPVMLGPDDDDDGIPEPNDPLYDPEEDTHWDPYYVPPSRGTPGTNGPTERAKMVKENDVIVGLLLDFLDTTDDPRAPGQKLIDNTLFIFTSDNGSDLRALPAVGGAPQPSDGVVTPFRGKKGTPWEGGTRVPMIAAWPGRIPAGAVSDALIGQQDFFATVAAIVGHDLHPTEAVDSDNILPALTNTSTTRTIDLVYKFKERLLMRRGDLKLRTRESDFADTNDRFGDGLDFLDLVTEQFYNLHNDLGEQSNKINDPAYTADIADMLATLQSYVSQGYSRPGAAPSQNGVNFLGGDFHTPANWISYTAELDAMIPGEQTSATAFLFVDGSADNAVSTTRVIQRRGIFDFISAGSQLSAITSNTVWRLEGGTLRDQNSAIRIDEGSTLVIDGGTLDLSVGNNFLRLSKGDGSVRIHRGSAQAVVLAFGVLNIATPGAKTVVFGRGDGVLTLTNPDPIRFGDAGDTANDWIGFETGSRGRLITRLSAADFESLWTAGRLRLDGHTANDLALSFDAVFTVTDNGDGRTTLALKNTEPTDLNADGSTDAFDVAELATRAALADPSADIDGSNIIDSIDLTLFNAYAFPSAEAP